MPGVGSVITGTVTNRAGSQIPELLTLATTVDTWWPEINAFVATGITNAATEGYNRLIKQVKRIADSETQPTRRAGYDSAAPTNSGPQPGLAADCPVKIEEPDYVCHASRAGAALPVMQHDGRR